MKKRVLCFGDSNTWGYIPSENHQASRYGPEVRWTGKLQAHAVSDFEIVEEGLNGRTTTLDEPGRVGRNGLIYLEPCLESQNPLDGVILMLGANDLKLKFNPDVAQIAERMRALIHVTKRIAKTINGAPAQIILGGSYCPRFEFTYEDFKYKEVGTLGLKLEDAYAALAAEEQVHFLSLKGIESSQKDGVHLDPEMHFKLAGRVYKKLLEIL